MSSRSRLPGRATTAEHQAAVARRLDLLRAELASTPALRAVADDHLADADGPDGLDGLDGLDGPGGPGGPDGPDGPDGPGDLDPWWGEATRVRGVAVGPDDPPPWSATAPPTAPTSGPVPVPGRHAARRRRELAEAVVPDSLRGRVVLGPTQLAVVAVVVAIGLAVTAWAVVRSRPEPLAAAPATAVSSAPGEAPLVELAPAAATGAGAGAVTGVPTSPPPGGASGLPAAASVTVDVAGKVRRPGIAVLDAGARVVDAIEAAGGARQGVDLTSLNLARPLVDGEQVLVGADPVPGVAASALATAGAAPSTPGAPAGALVDLNAATVEQLDTLPEVGPVTAGSIIAWRDQNGGFSAVDELLEVDGIGETTLARIAPYVTV